jgi:hypothetical protein
LDQDVVVLFLEPHGRKITERRVQSAGVVHLVDEAWKPRDHVSVSPIVAEVVWSAKTPRQSSSAVEETVLVVKSVQDGVRHYAAGPVESMPLSSE